MKDYFHFRSPEEIQPDLTVQSARRPFLSRFPSDLLESSVDPRFPSDLIESSVDPPADLVLPRDFQSTSEMVRVYQPPTVNNSRAPLNGFQVK